MSTSQAVKLVGTKKSPRFQTPNFLCDAPRVIAVGACDGSLRLSQEHSDSIDSVGFPSNPAGELQDLSILGGSLRFNPVEILLATAHVQETHTKYPSASIAVASLGPQAPAWTSHHVQIQLTGED